MGTGGNDGIGERTILSLAMYLAHICIWHAFVFEAYLYLYLVKIHICFWHTSPFVFGAHLYLYFALTVFVTHLSAFSTDFESVL